MNMKKLAMCAAMAALPCATALAEGERTFVLWDQWLQMPAVCYRLDPGWEGKGQITWNLRGDNKYYASTILSCPKKHLYVQTAGPMLTMGGVLTPQLYAEFQDANVMAQGIAAEINRSIVEPGLSGFVAVGGRFTQDVPQVTRQMAAAYDTGSGMATISAFGFEGTYRCMYGGVECEAKFVASFAVSISAVRNPKIPKICSFVRVSPCLFVAPPGKMERALRKGGKMFASAFVNRHWCERRDSTLAALLQGTIEGREAGWALWRQSQAETAAMLERVRVAKSQQIREVREVANPFEPGKKVERPSFFDKSWINSRQDMMILSDSSLEPNTIRGLMEQGEWLPAN